MKGSRCIFHGTYSTLSHWFPWIPALPQFHWSLIHGPLARFVNLRVAHAPEMPGTFPPPPRLSDPDMHHGTCVTHVPWCMPGSLTSSFFWSRRWGETSPAFPAHAQPTILRIWQEAHKLYPWSARRCLRQLPTPYTSPLGAWLILQTWYHFVWRRTCLCALAAG